MNLTTRNVPSINREFEFLFVFDDKRKAKRKAARCRRHGFHTRVTEISPGMFAVFRRQKELPVKRVRDTSRSLFVAGFVTDSAVSATRS